MTTAEQVKQIPATYFTDLEKILSKHHYKNNANIIYKGHIPNSAFLLVKGEIKLTLSRTKVITLGEGSLIGISELINAVPIGFDVEIKTDSIVYIIDKTSVSEILKGNNNSLRQIFEEELI